MIVAGLMSHAVYAKTVTIEHAMGKTTVEEMPQRVVVLGIGPLDALDSFGIQPVAVTKTPHSPDYLKQYESDQYPSAGSLFEPDYEAIYMQKPDLIIAGPRNAQNYQELSKIAPTIIYSVDATGMYWPKVQQQWRNLGKIFRMTPKVEAKIAQLDQVFQAIAAYNQKHQTKALTVMSSGGNLSSFGAQSRFKLIYQDFGFKEAAKSLKASRHGDLISYEFIHDKNPQVLFVIDKAKLLSQGKSTTQDDFDNDLVRATDAYQQRKIVFLDVNAWYVAIAGVHSTELMLDDIKRVISVK